MGGEAELVDHNYRGGAGGRASPGDRSGSRESGGWLSGGRVGGATKEDGGEVGEGPFLSGF